jgi:protein-S-isoprenylcysteine O-methyltransferase Ste14
LPQFSLTIQNGFWLMVPLFLMRFAIPRWINRESLRKLEFFPETLGIERNFLTVYFITNTIIIFSPLIMRLQPTHPLLIIGCIIYLVGCIFFLLSVIPFAKDSAFTSEGIYRLSRNPMYIGYYLIFLGTGLLLNSILFIILIQIYQIAVHFLVLSEERWCLNKFGSTYMDYLNTVPRYLFIKKVHSSE